MLGPPLDPLGSASFPQPTQTGPKATEPGTGWPRRAGRDQVNPITQHQLHKPAELRAGSACRRRHARPGMRDCRRAGPPRCASRLPRRTQRCHRPGEERGLNPPCLRASQGLMCWAGRSRGHRYQQPSRVSGAFLVTPIPEFPGSERRVARICHPRGPHTPRGAAICPRLEPRTSRSHSSLFRLLLGSK